MDELIDILDVDGNMTGRTAMKSEAHKNGWFHQTVHIWFYTSNGNLLIQQRGKNKDTYPLLWDVSVAGHIGAGESIGSSALREIEEEVGIQIKEAQLEKIGIFKSIQKHSDELMDYEFHHTFITVLNVPLENLIKQESEVEQLKLIPINQFNNELKSSSTTNYVPHGDLYYDIICKRIKDRLT